MILLNKKTKDEAMRDIDKIIEDDENQVVEWKESWQDKYLE